MKTFCCCWLLALVLGTATARPADPPTWAVAFYNVENLFDIYDDPHHDDSEYLPESKGQWTRERYQKKLRDLAQVISRINEGGGFPVLVGLCEVENRRVVEELARQKSIKKAGYRVAHAPSIDERGVDVALLYDPKRFKLLSEHAIRVDLRGEADTTTRDVLWVRGLLGGRDTAFVFVNHWPSRRNPESARLKAAGAVRRVVDSLFHRSTEALILVMGDFNDSPSDSSTRLLAGPSAGHPNILVNVMAELAQPGVGTHCYRGEWTLLDQFFLSPAWFTARAPWQYVPQSAAIFAPVWLQQTDPKYLGWPYRTYVGPKYLGGYSDHFPVRLHIRRRAS